MNCRTILSLYSMVIFRSDMEVKGKLRVFVALDASGTGWTGAVAATAIVAVVVLMIGRRNRERGHRPGSFVGQGKKRIAIHTGHPTAGILPEEEDDEGEDEAKTDSDSEWDDSHVGCRRGRWTG